MVIIPKSQWPKLLNLYAISSLYAPCTKIIPISKIQNKRRVDGFFVLISFFLCFPNFL